ncbi:MAG: hypothetical protein NC828_06975, partial [Candidatus Omnitrophica bacterium]|nr:hypothetical protein [Candidatus Omnitrophota bacterium]
MSFASIPPLISAFLYLILGLFVFYKNPRSPINFAFFLVCYCTFHWQGTWVFIFNTQNEILANVIARIGYSGIIFIPITFYHLFINLCRKDTERKYLKIAYISGLVFLGFNWWSNYFIQGVHSYSWGFYPEANWLHAIYLIFLFAIDIRIFIMTIKNLTILPIPSKERTETIYFLIALGFYNFAAADFLVNYGVDYYPMGFIAIALTLGTIAYAITKTELMDIRVVINRTGAWIATVIFLGSIYLGLVSLYRIYISPRIDWIFLAWSIVYGIIVGETFQRIRFFLQTTGERKFIRGFYDFPTVVTEISNVLASAITIEDTVNPIRAVLDKHLELNSIEVLVLEGEKYRGVKGDAEFPQDHILVKYLATKKDLSFVDELEADQRKEMQIHKFLKDKIIFLPCFSGEELKLIFCLSGKASEDPFTDVDLKLFKTIINQINIVLDRIRPYERIKREYEANQQKLVDTERQLARSRHLAAIGTMAAGVAHEIRNPLAVIYMKTEKLSEETANWKYLKDFKEAVLRHCDRINFIIRGMMNLAREEKEKEVKVNINEIVGSTLESFVLGPVRLIREFNPLPEIVGDPGQLRQVFVNLIDNADLYTIEIGQFNQNKPSFSNFILFPHLSSEQ